MEYTSLNELISYLKYGTKLNICVVFLNDNGNFKTKLPTEMAIHTKEYCTYMKSTIEGYKSCVKCRNTALEKAIEDKKAFGGLCFKGVYEYCYPVCEGDDVIAVIFVGNIFPKNPDEKIYEFEDTFEKSFDGKKCEDICKILENQIKLLIKEYSNIKTEYNPLISNIINFIAESYTTDIYVSDISKIFGYNVKYLYTEIGKILGLDQTHHFIIIGAGNLGQALGNYMNFERRGFIFSGMFDKNPEVVGKEVRGIKVQPMEAMEQFVRENDIDIAVLTIPKTGAVEVAEKLVANGIKAIWNFAHVDLNVPEGIQVENVHLSDSLMKLSYNFSRYKKEKEGK